VTLTYNEGRPRIEVNGGSANAWTSALPEPSRQPKQSRGITRGTYRGNNDIFSFDIPPAALHSGTNTITIHVESATKSYPGFLSPNIVFDAVDLVTTTDALRAAAAPLSGR
jgi:rhamnogalacturonan endolyase